MNLRLDRLARRLETERLVLRVFEPKDAQALFELVQSSRAHLDPWLTWPERVAAFDALERWIARPYDASEANRLGLFTKAGDELVGAGGVRARSLDPVSTFFYVDIGYWLAAGALGRGYATEAARRLARHAFEDLAAPRVEIRTEPHNLRSRRVAERLGFRFEGVQRHVGLRRGRPVDLALYALIAAEQGGVLAPVSAS